MLHYSQRLHCEATLHESDEGHEGDVRKAMAATGHKPLSTIARNPIVIEAVNRVRVTMPKEEWAPLNRMGAPLTDDQRELASIVWYTMPPYCCIMDAVAILARL